MWRRESEYKGGEFGISENEQSHGSQLDNGGGRSGPFLSGKLPKNDNFLLVGVFLEAR